MEPDVRALRAALDARATLAGGAYRWVDGEHDGVTVDLFGDVAILSFYRPSDDALERAWASGLLEAGGARSVYVKRRPKEARRAANESLEALAPVTPLLGPPVESLTAQELGVPFLIRPANGLSVGLYLDARELRRRVRARASGLRVLNLFAYTCGFGVAARLGGAAEVVNVDLSRRVLDWGEENYRLNGLAPSAGEFRAAEAFGELKLLAKRGRQFDLAIVDPPSFSTTKGERFSAEKDHGRLLQAVGTVLAPGGTVYACSNLDRWSLPEVERRSVAALAALGARAVDRFGAPPLDFDARPSRLKVVELRLQAS
ncbi:MAG: class I SAM-dependent methyltransferase [Myxococcaceae bacterium]|nr:class I SAM-dependent methyltransferase [Myxococcaceae bacterium]